LCANRLALAATVLHTMVTASRSSSFLDMVNLSNGGRLQSPRQRREHATAEAARQQPSVGGSHHETTRDVSG
jgi:hypothetical protein